MSKPELLAPAGSREALEAAVENGADAVYLGGKMFNARESAANFDFGELAGAIDYAHLRGVKIYVTVNTLIADNEMSEALDFLYTLQNLGADAVIIQDAGLAAMARACLPELTLHASTQMTAHNTPMIRELLAAGFSRVVLAREMSLQEIKKIKAATGAELEVFVHGALCICYSGQCLFSSMIGGRSGNRGRCAQPCRMKYHLLGGSGRPAVNPAETGECLLSPRDLNMSAHLPELIKAGVSSFKIEGRMKRPEYVATVTRIYRGLIDLAVSGRDFRVEDCQSEELAQIFNRDFTSGYFFGNQGRDMMSYKRPNNRGVLLGRVRGFDRNNGLVEVALEKPLRTGDGLEVWVSRGGRLGFTVNEIFLRGKTADRAAPGDVAGLAVPGRVTRGDRVFKTHDADLIKKAQESFSPRGRQRRVPVVFKVEGGPGLPLTVSTSDGDGYTAVSATPSTGQAAGKTPLTEDFLKEKLGRLGNTPFSMAGLECRIEGGLFYPVSEINEARRLSLESLEKMILEDRRQPPVKEDVFRARLKKAGVGQNKLKALEKRMEAPLLAVSVGDMQSLRSAAGAGADIVYFGHDLFRSKPAVSRADLVEAAELCAIKKVSLFLSTPRIVKDNELDAVLSSFSGVPAVGILAGNLGVLGAVREKLPGIAVAADFGLNAFNRNTVDFLMRRGAERVVISPELTMDQVRQIAGHFEVEVFVQGALELMVSEYCLPGAVLGGRSGESACAGPCRDGGFRLKDRTRALFPVETDRYCRMHIFNSRDLCLIEDIPLLAEAGVSVVRVEARRENPGWVEAVTGAYRLALDSLAAGRKGGPDLRELREKLAAMSPQGVTKGHYYRGV